MLYSIYQGLKSLVESNDGEDYWRKGGKVTAEFSKNMQNQKDLQSRLCGERTEPKLEKKDQ